jgi:hypothetical protein
MIDMATCIEKTKSWPDASADVSLEEIEKFLDHAKACPYHAELLRKEERQEEESLRSVFRLARGLDSHGDVLQGRVLDAAIAEQERRLKFWKPEVNAKFPFSHIALYNGGREIASCGKFLDFRKHESVNELDPRAGIQIRGFTSSDEEKDLLLGFYPLDGVRHDGDEQLLPLDNGYTVGLRICRQDEKTFAVHFRCVESSVIEEERSGANCSGSRVRKALARAAGAGNSSGSGSSSIQLAAANIAPRESNNPPAFARWSEHLERLRSAVVRSARGVRRELLAVTNGILLKAFLTALTERSTVAVLVGALLLVGLFVVDGRESGESAVESPTQTMKESPDTVPAVLPAVQAAEYPGHLSNDQLSESPNFLVATLLNSEVSEMDLRASSCPVNLSSVGYQAGPTSLFTIYDGDTIRKGEFTFSVAYSDFDRDPGEIVETPLSFNLGLNDHVELFLKTNDFRAISVGNLRNLSSFYQPNSELPNSTTSTIPSIFTIAPGYLPDAPFFNRLYGESSDTDRVVGSKVRMTGPNDALRVGFIPFYRWYPDKANDFHGLNSLQRGASPGGDTGDFGLIGFLDGRLSQDVNLSATLGYILNSNSKNDTIGSSVLLDRPDEFLSGVGFDFQINKTFEHIAEARSTVYVSGGPPNAFDNNPVDAIGGVKIYPTRRWGIGVAYRRHMNQQDEGHFNENNFNTGVQNLSGVLVPGRGIVIVPGTTSAATTNAFPIGFKSSDNPNGFIFQFWAGHRNPRMLSPNQPPTVSVSSSSASILLLPRERTSSGSCKASARGSVDLAVDARDPDNDTLLYTWSVSGGTIKGEGRSVTWDLSGVGPGTYSAQAKVSDGNGHTVSASVTLTAGVCEAYSKTKLSTPIND